MMNALPLPNGPMDIMGGSSKTRRPLPNSDKSGGAEGGSSFASTLKAIHDHRRTPNDALQREDGESHKRYETDDMQGDQPIDEKSETAGHDMPAEATPPPVPPSENAEAAEAEAPAAPAADISAPAQAEGGTPDEGQNQERSGMDPSVGIQQKKAAWDKMRTAENTLGEEKLPQMAPEAATKTKEMLETGSQKLSGSLRETQTPGGPSDAAPTASVAGPNAPGPTDQPDEDLPEDTKTEGVPKALRDETGDKALRTEESPLKRDGGAGENNASEMSRFAKQLQRKANSGNAEHPHDVAKRSAAPEHPVASVERPSNSETSPNPSGPASAAARESALASSHETSGHVLDRQGVNDPPPSFSTAATAGRAETTSSGPTTATTMATTERFHQENFNQLVERAVFTLRGEQSEARIALKPDQLGHVQMRVVTEHHLVSIKIMTESPMARDLIDTHAHHLKAELQQQGLTVEHIEVSVSDGQGDTYRGERQRESFLRQLASQGRFEQEDETPRPPHGTHRPSGGRSRSSGIDYFA